jgi:hypothetical protein
VADEAAWPTPETIGMTTVETNLPFVTYHYPYTDDEIALIGSMAVDATCHMCGDTTRIAIRVAADPADDEVPAAGYHHSRMTWLMDHLHGRKLRAS